MKNREGFVSNSSSSSFIISRRNLTDIQVEMIRRHIFFARELNISERYGYGSGYDDEDRDAWFVEEKGNHIIVSTHMDNFDMHHFLLTIGVPENDIQWQDY